MPPLLRPLRGPSTFWLLAVVLPALVLAAPPAVPAAATAAPRNILFFLVDDLGVMDIGANNPKTFYETPNIDRLAATGMRFTAGYAACPVCSPTRASLLTGRYPQRCGITDYIGAPQPETWPRPTRLLPAPYATALPLGEITLAEVLRGAGFATAHFGKWHLGREGFWPEDQGFQLNFGGIDRGGPYGGKKYFSPYGNPRLTDGPDGEHLPDRLATECVRFLEENRDRPFFANFWFYDVHTPLMARPDLQAKYEEKARHWPAVTWAREREAQVRQVQNHAVYAGMVEAMDQAVGKVLNALDRLGLTDKTIVVFTSDNGGLSTAEGHPTANVPFRAGKGWPYEGGVRVPLILRAPGTARAGAVCGVPVSSPDFFPTLIHLAGGKVPQGLGLDGVNLEPLLRGRSIRSRPLFWHYPHYGNQQSAPSGAVRDGKWKLIEWYEDGRPELFDLEKDPGETTDLAQAHPRLTKRLLAELRRWRSDVGAKMPSPNPAWRGR